MGSPAFPRRERARSPSAVAALVLLLLAGLATAPSATSEPQHEARAICAWHEETIRVLVLPPLPGYALHHEGPPIRIPGSIIFRPETDLLWASAHADAARRAVETWERTARLHAPHLSDLRFDVRIADATLRPDEVERAHVVIAFAPAQDAGGRTHTACASVRASIERELERPDDPIWVAFGAFVVMNEWFLWHFTTNDTYNVVLHEFGHILGLQHVDAPDDLMRPVYPYTVGNVRNPAMCVSTLDLARTSANFQWLDGATPYVRRPAAIHQPASAWALRCSLRSPIPKTETPERACRPHAPQPQPRDPRRLRPRAERALLRDARMARRE